MPGIIQTLAMNFYNARNSKLAEPMTQRLIHDLEQWPRFKPEATLVFGAGEVSGAVAVRAAEMFRDGTLGDTVYFLGGIEPLKKPLAKELIPLLKKNGNIDPPQPGKKEGPYMERVFLQELRRHGIEPVNVRTLVEDKSRHTQENIHGAVALGADRHATLGLLSLPYHGRRVMGTLRKIMGPAAALYPTHAWPKEIGVEDANSAIARYFIVMEGKKTMLPTPETASYVKQGFCLPVDINAEKELAQAMADAHRMTKIATPQARSNNGIKP